MTNDVEKTVLSELGVINRKIGKMSNKQDELAKYVKNHVTHLDKRVTKIENSASVAFPKAMSRFAERFPKLTKGIITTTTLIILTYLLGMSAGEAMSILAKFFGM